MHESWDHLIERKYSRRACLFNLHVTKLTKFKSGDYNQYLGYCNDDNIVNVSYYSNNYNNFIGIGIGETEYEAENMQEIPVDVTDELDDDIILDILKSYYKWKIDDFFDICS
tara:strand:- start:28 stop:363 length:336 start_codon:yes stop_codon:yes gene_type:complete